MATARKLTTCRPVKSRACARYRVSMSRRRSSTWQAETLFRSRPASTGRSSVSKRITGNGSAPISLSLPLLVPNQDRLLVPIWDRGVLKQDRGDVLNWDMREKRAEISVLRHSPNTKFRRSPHQHWRLLVLNWDTPVLIWDMSRIGYLPVPNQDRSLVPNQDTQKKTFQKKINKRICRVDPTLQKF